MAKANELVVSLGLTTTTFHSKIKEVNQTMKLVKSEFSNASSGVKNFEKSQQGLKTKLATLNKEIELTKTKVGLYKTEIETSKKKLEEKNKALEEVHLLDLALFLLFLISAVKVYHYKSLKSTQKSINQHP